MLPTFLALSLALAGTADTAAVPDTSIAPTADTAVPAADTATVDTALPSASMLRGEEGGLGCDSRGGHPLGLGALGVMLLVLRRNDDG